MTEFNKPLDPELAERLRELAQRPGISMTAAMAKAIELVVPTADPEQEPQDPENPSA